MFLEGTGAMVLDHVDRVAYAARSKRTDPVALERFCTHFNYEPMVFDAVDASGVPIYHTNVLMCIATDFALIGLDSISSHPPRDEIVQRLGESGREVMALSHEQIANFAGNAIELQGRDGFSRCFRPGNEPGSMSICASTIHCQLHLLYEFATTQPNLGVLILKL